MNQITAARKALEARLGTISPAAGYLTAAGANVRTGWVNEVLKEADVSFPLIIVQPAKAATDSVSNGIATRVPLAFNVVGAVQAGTDFEEAIDSLTCDLVRCLCPVPGAGVGWRSAEMGGVTLSAPEQAPPGDGLSAACVLLVVELTVQLPAAFA